MREYSTPLNITPPSGPLTDDVLKWVTSEPDRPLLSRRAGDGTWQDVTAAEFHDELTSVAKGLVGAGIGPGERVAILSSTRYEWTLLDYAIWWIGATTVPVYETSSAEQIRLILADSAATAVIAESSEHLHRLAQVRAHLPELTHVWSLHGGAISVLQRLGSEVTDEDLESRRAAVTADDLASIIYTSGTTGVPKGAMLTHGNFQTQLTVATAELHQLFDADDASTLLFLPLAHVFARIIQVGCIKAGARMGHSSDIKGLVDDLATFQPSFILAVPRVFEKIFNAASQRATADGRGAIFDRAAKTAIAWSRNLDRGRFKPALNAQHALFSKLVYGKLRDALGGRCSFAISGGAPLGERLGHFYRGIGLTVLEGYGLTETTAALSVNVVGATKIGSVGRPLPGTAVRVADDGELLFKGTAIFSGYWGVPNRDDVIDPQGWFHTGDMGEVDDEGFVRITGRKKEILVTAGGKNVAPAALEDHLRAHALIDQCLVVGDGQPYIAALLTVDRESLMTWAEARGKSEDLVRLLDDPDLLADLQLAVDEANSTVSKAESIRKFRVLIHEWTEEGGQLTPSMKLRRNVVLREFRDEIDALYAR